MGKPSVAAILAGTLFVASEAGAPIRVQAVPRADAEVETVFYVSSRTGPHFQGPSLLHQVDRSGREIGSVDLTGWGSPIAVRRDGAAADAPACVVVYMSAWNVLWRVDRHGGVEQVHRFRKTRLYAPRASGRRLMVSLAVEPGSGDLVFSDSLWGDVAALTGWPPDGERTILPLPPPEPGRQPSATVATAGDGALVVSTRYPPAVFRVPPGAKALPKTPDLARECRLAADPASARWAAVPEGAAPRSLALFDGAKALGEVPFPDAWPRDALVRISFGPGGVLYALAATKDFLEVAAVDRTRREFLGLFRWEGASARKVEEDVMAFAAGPPLPWSRPTTTPATAELLAKGPPWRRPFREARREALRRGLPLLLYLSADGPTIGFQGILLEPERVPAEALAAALDAAVWAKIEHDVREPPGGERISAGSETLAVLYRLGIHNVPQVLIVDPRTLEILEEPGAYARSIATAIPAAARLVERPGEEVAALSARMAEARRALAEGRGSEAATILEELAKGSDPWRFSLEAAEILRGFPGAPPRGTGHRLLDPDPDERARGLEDILGMPEAEGRAAWTEHRARVLDLALDADGYVRHRAVQALARWDRQALLDRAEALLRDSGDPTRCAILQCFDSWGNRKAAAAVVRLYDEVGDDACPSRTPHVVRMFSLGALGGCGDASHLALLAPLLGQRPIGQAGEIYANAALRIALRSSRPGRLQAAKALVAAFPHQGRGGSGGRRWDEEQARRIHEALKKILGVEPAPFPEEWTEAARKDLEEAWSGRIR